MSERVETIVIGQRALVREGLVRMLPPDTYDVVAQLPDVTSIDAVVDGPTSPHLVLLVNGDDQAATTATIATLKQRHPQCRVVVLTQRYDLAHLASALRAGAQGYLVDTLCCEAFLKCLDLVLLGECVLPSAVADYFRKTWAGEEVASPADPPPAKAAPRPPAAAPLSCRESEILQCLAEGVSNKVIARRFAIAEATVKVHLKAILRKLGARNRTQAALWSIAHLQTTGPEPGSGTGAVPVTMVRRASISPGLSDLDSA